MFAVDDHEISCVLSDIPSQITGVLWTPATTTLNEYTLEDGTINGNTQTSKLTISAAKLVSLKSASATQTFTCKITVGTSNTEVTATQTITIFNPSEFVCQIIFCRHYFASKHSLYCYLHGFDLICPNSDWDAL